MRIALIFGIDGDGCVAQHGLGSCGRNYNFSASVGKWITDMPELALFFGILHLGIRKRSDTYGTPVYDPLTPIYKALFIKLDKGLLNSSGADFVHGEALSFPVAGAAKRLELVNYCVAILFFPSPNPFQKRFSAQVVAGETLFFSQCLLNSDLSSNAGVVIAGEPKGIESVHTLISY